MREPILRAVAMPPRIFLAPFIPAMANFVIQAAWMFILIGMFNVNPLVSLITILLGHIFFGYCRHTRTPPIPYVASVGNKRSSDKP